nr:MAG TPA: peptidase [Caudoviricetes sp.]
MVKKLTDICLKLNVITNEDLEQHTVLELCLMIVKRLNEVIDNYNNFIDSGLQDELRAILNGWLEDGTMSELVQETAYQDLLRKLENRTAVSVKDFGAVGDGEVDDTDAIQRAIDDANLGCKMVFVPVGTYKISRSLNLQGISKIQGAGKIGSRVSNIINANDNVYALTSPIGEDSSYEISGLNIESKNGIDLRTNSAYKIKNVNIHDCVFKATKQGGVGIHMNNTDFTVIEHNYFEQQFMTHIRVSGYIASTSLAGNKNSTAIQIRGNAFINLPNSGTYGVGVSVEQVDSVTISENDFCFKGTAIDVGGQAYFTHKIGTINNYNLNSADSDKAVGCTTNVVIEKNHFESYQEGVLVSGGGIANTHDTQIIYNNFQTPLANSKAIRLIDSCWNTVIEHNEIDLKDETTATGIDIEYANRTFVGLNNICGASQHFIIYDKTGDSRGYRNIVWEQTEAGKKRDELGWQVPRLTLGRLTSDRVDLKAKIGSAPEGAIPEIYSESFNRYNELGANQLGTVYDFPTYHSINVEINGVIYSSFGQQIFSLKCHNQTIINDLGTQHNGIEFSIDEHGLKMKNANASQGSFYILGEARIVKF